MIFFKGVNREKPITINMMLKVLSPYVFMLLYNLNINIVEFNFLV